jgi:hypothetical protein
MMINIFDVAHGFCGYVVADNGNTMLIDCGHNDETGFYPANYLVAVKSPGIHRFFPLNYDEDHLSGLPRLRQISYLIPIHILHRNPTITPDQLRALKLPSGPLGPGITALLDMLATYTANVSVPPVYPSVEFEVFYNSYPSFTDTNNLSQVLFLHYPGLSIVFPGDLEKAGWRTLLQRGDFRAHLARVNIFVASHHGRESGYAPEVFDVCEPDIVVISDESKQYDTQETNYGQHSTGITWNQTETRKVLTTRKDGMITITKDISSGYYVQASK